MAVHPAARAMDKTTNRITYFQSTHKRTGPTAHLKVLRGDQDSIHLLTDKYMSPCLHNSSDTYHRHLGRQLQHGKELQKGEHGRQWIHNQAGRQAFSRLTTHLEYYCAPFVHGDSDAPTFARMKEDKARKEKEEFWKGEWVKKEERGMGRCGWNPESLVEIEQAIIKEEVEELEQVKKHSTKSLDTVVSDNSDVFDSEEQDDTDEYDEFDHLYSDCEPAAITTTFIAHSIIRNDNNLSSTIDKSLDKETSLLLDTTESFEEFVRRSSAQSIRDPMASPSAILQKFAYKPGSGDSDESDSSDDEDEAGWSSVSPLTPSSPNSSCGSEEDFDIIDTDQSFHSIARERKAKFLADLLAVRAQVEMDIEEDWDYKVRMKEEERREHNREGCKASWKLKQQLERYGMHRDD